MTHRNSRYEPRDDSPYVARGDYPGPASGVNEDAYEYIGPETFADPPPHTFQDAPRHPRHPRRRSPPRRHDSDRASTLPPRPSRSPPSGRRRDASPSARTRHSDSPPRHYRRSRRDGAEAPKPSKTVSRAAAAGAAGAAGAAAADPKPAKMRFIDRPMFKNMKSYGQKGLSTLGEVVDAYAAAQDPTQRGRPRGSRDAYHDEDYDEDRYDRRRPHRRYRPYSPSPSPSPPRRRATMHSGRGRSTTHDRRHRSPSYSPAPRGRGYESEGGHGRRRRGYDRREPESVSPSPPRRRGQSYSHHKDAPVRSKSSKKHETLGAVKKELKAPDPEFAQRWQLAARAALEAGGLAAFRLRKEPGSWTGAKGAKVATAALGAAAMDAFVDKDPRRQSQGGVKGMAESVVGGLLASKLMGVPSSSKRAGRRRY